MIGKPGSPITPTGDGTPSDQQPQLEGGENREDAALSVAVSMDESEYQYWVKSIEQFQQSHSRISITLTNIGNEDPDEARKQASEAGEPFDIMLLDNDRVREFAMQGYLLPIDEIVTGDSAADQLEALTAMVKWNGSLWGVALDSNPLIAVWSKKLLKAAGVSEPPRDLAELKSVFAAVSEAKPGSISPFNLNTADARDLSAWLGMFPDQTSAAANLSPFSAAMKLQLHFAAEHAGELTRFNPLQQQADLLHAFQADTLLGAVLPWTVYQSLSSEERDLLTLGSMNGPLVRSNGRSFVLTAENRTVLRSERMDPRNDFHGRAA